MDNSKLDGNLDSGDNSETSADGTDTGLTATAPEGTAAPAAEPAAAEPEAAESAAAEPAAAEPAAVAPAAVATPVAATPTAAQGAVPPEAPITPAPPYGTPGAATTAPTAPTAPPGQPAQPTLVTRTTGVLRGVAAERYIAATVGAAAVYAASWLLSLVFTLVAFVVAADDSLDWGLAFAAPAQIVGLAVAGTLTVGATIMGISASVSVLWLPLLVTAFLVVGTALVARRDERIAPSASRGIRWLLSGLSGLVLSILVLVIAAVTPLRFAMGDGSDTGFGVMSGSVSASSASFTAFLGALVLGTLVSYLARARVARRAAGIPAIVVPRAATSVLAAVRATVPVAGLYFGVLAVIVTLGLLITSVVNSGIDALLTAFFWLPTLVVDGLGLVNLAPVSLGGGLATLAASTGGSETTFWLPTSLPGWATILVLIVNLVLIVGTGVVLSLRRAQLMLSAAMSWATTIVTFAVAGIVISIIGGIGMWTTIDTSGLGEGLDGLLGGLGAMAESASAASGVVGLVPWTFVVFAALGALVETVAVFVAPSLVQLVPAGALARVGRLTAIVGVPFAMPGTAPVADAAVPAAAPVSATSPVAASVAAPATADGLAPAPVTASAAAPGTAPGTGLPAVVPMDPAKKRRALIVLGSVGGAVVLVLGAAVAVSVVNQMVFSPQHRVETYLDAIVAKDASGALAIGDVDAAESERVLLTDALLEATEGGITGYSVKESKTTGEFAVVTVDLELGDATEEMTYSLEKSGRTALVFDEWAMQPTWLPSLPVTVSSGITELEINGVALELTEADIEAAYLSFPVFPGEYVIGTGGDNEWLTAEPQTVKVGVVESGDSAQLELEPTEKFTASVDKQVADFLADCVAQKDLSADDCPISVYDYGTISDVVWTIDEPAVTTLNNSYSGEWNVSTDKRGSATVKYTNTDYSGEVLQETETVQFSINGSVVLKGGTPVFTEGY
jgi:hypothetical protein